jgi:hypothetical protein
VHCIPYCIIDLYEVVDTDASRNAHVVPTNFFGRTQCCNVAREARLSRLIELQATDLIVALELR